MRPMVALHVHVALIALMASFVTLWITDSDAATSLSGAYGVASLVLAVASLTLSLRPRKRREKNR